MEAAVTAVLMFFATGLIGGLALLAQWARKNRSAEITLVVVLLFSSFLVAVLGAAVAYQNYTGLAAQGGGGGGDDGTLLAVSVLIPVLAGVLGFALCVPPLRRITSRHGRQRAGEPRTEFEAAPEPAEAGEGEPGGRWAQPPVFYGLWLSVMVLAQSVVSLLSFSRMADAGAFDDAAITPAVIAVSELPFVVVALCGVGFLVRRDFEETLARLGYGPVNLRQVSLVPLFVAAALALAFAADALFVGLQPDLAERVNEVSQGLFSTEGMSLASAVLFGLLIGVGAAIGEETLFRGAVQPALGITITSVLFACIHTQYGPSIVLGHVFLLSVGLGLMRRYANTTLTFITHATYNFTLVLLSYYFG